MRYLLLSSCLFVIMGCGSAYKHLQKAGGEAGCLQKFKPQFTSVLYTTQVNVVGRHLSGLLLIKTMPDSSIRMVFSSEMGLSFFDFEFGANGNFKVHYIIQRMNKKPVINTLRNDLGLILMRNLQTENAEILKDGDSVYFKFPQKKGSNYYITSSNCSELVRIETASKRKPKATVIMKNYHAGIPDTIGISHTGFAFTIGLKRLKR